MADNEIKKVDLLCKLLKDDNSLENEINNIISSLESNTLSFIQYVCYYCIKNKIGNIKIISKILFFIKKFFALKFKGTLTLTFGEVAESHVGMQKIGKMAEHGFSFQDMISAKQNFEKNGCETLLIHLNNFLPSEESIKDNEEKNYLKIAKTEEDFQAYVLVIRNGLNCLFKNDIEDFENVLLSEMLFFDWDTKLYNERRGIVQNKNARYNLNFDKHSQKSNFEKGMGTTIAFKDTPFLKKLKNKIYEVVGDKAKDLKCEGNKYYNPKNTGIGYHGDTERRKVIGVRLGNKMNMHWMWYYNSKPRGLNVKIILQPGDIYIMSEKTVGTDWRPNIKRNWKNKRYTLRHAAGAKKYTTETGKIQIKYEREFDNNITIGDIYIKDK